jgi:glutathione S-transferase
MKLLGSSRSPYVRKVRIVLAEKKIDCEQEDTPDDEALAMALQALPEGATGKPPVLVLEDGTFLFDGKVITDYIDSLSPHKKLLFATNRERALVSRWEAAANALIDATTRCHEKRGKARSLARERLAHTLAYLENELGSRAFCVGKSISMADIALGTALDYLAETEGAENNWREKYQALAHLQAKLTERPSFLSSRAVSA